MTLVIPTPRCARDRARCHQHDIEYQALHRIFVKAQVVILMLKAVLVQQICTAVTLSRYSVFSGSKSLYPLPERFWLDVILLRALKVPINFQGGGAIEVSRNRGVHHQPLL